MDPEIAALQVALVAAFDALRAETSVVYNEPSRLLPANSVSVYGACGSVGWTFRVYTADGRMTCDCAGCINYRPHENRFHLPELRPHENRFHLPELPQKVRGVYVAAAGAGNLTAARVCARQGWM